MDGLLFHITFIYHIPKLGDASVPLEQVQDKIVEDSKRNIRNQHSPNGRAFVPLRKVTIEKKRKKGYSWPEGALYAKAIMFNNIFWRKAAKNKYEVTVKGVGKPPRNFLALIHTDTGVHSRGGNITRPFLGISSKTQDWALDRMMRWINKCLSGAQTKYIKIS